MCVVAEDADDSELRPALAEVAVGVAVEFEVVGGASKCCR